MVMDQGDGVLGVQAGYDAWARTYDSVHNATRDLSALRLRHEAFPLEQWDVLELGCGTGWNSEYLAGRCRSLVATDFSEGMLAQARERVPSPAVRFVQHDLTRPWPFEAGSFDLVLENLVLEHVPGFGTLFAEALRVLRPGGQLYLSELHPAKQYGGLQARFTDEGGALRLIEAYVHDAQELVNAPLQAGFRLERIGEHRDADAPKSQMPRLFTALFTRP
jgi:SAM-dependent methyltransferase